MSLVGLSADAESPYVLIQQREFTQKDGSKKVGKPVKGGDETGVPIAGAIEFLIGSLSARQRARILDQAIDLEPSDDGNAKVGFGGMQEAFLEACSVGLKGWRGGQIVDPKNNAIEFATTNSGRVAEGTLNRMRFEWIQELGGQIMGMNGDDDAQGEASAE